MGESGFGKPLANTFGDMLKVSNQNQGIGATPLRVGDTRGQDSALQIAKNQVRIIPVDSDGEIYVVLTKDGTPIFSINTATKEVIAATGVSFVGDGSRLAGITGATGGISNDATTNVVADATGDGNGDINFSIYNTLLMTLRNNGGANGGSFVIKSLNKDLLATLTGDEVAYVNVDGVASIQDASGVHQLVLADKYGDVDGGYIFDGGDDAIPIKDQDGIKALGITVVLDDVSSVAIGTLGTDLEIQIVNGEVTLGAGFANSRIVVDNVETSSITTGKHLILIDFDEISVSGGYWGYDGTSYGKFTILRPELYNMHVIDNYTNQLWNNGRPELAEIPYELQGASQTELVVNGDGSSATGWTTDGTGAPTIDVSGGDVKVTTTQDGSAILKNDGMLGLQSNKKYILSYKITQFSTSSNIKVYAHPGYRVLKTITGLEEEDGLVFDLRSGETNIYFGYASPLTAGDYFAVDDVSLKQIGNVLDLKPSNASSSAWTGTLGGQPVIAETSGSPIAMGNKVDGAIVATSTGATTKNLANSQKAGYVVDKIIAINKSGAAQTVNIYHDDGTTKIVDNFSLGVGAETSLPITSGREFQSSTEDKDINISCSVTGGDGVEFYIKYKPLV